MTRALRPGETLGRYSLLERLARGGMGEVWLASARGSSGFEKRLVLKTILPERSNTKLYVELFAQEARLSARLSHPNLVEVFDFAEDDGIFYLAMEYLRGRSLSQALNVARKHGESLPPWFALQVLADCCRGLDYAHEHTGIIHCDLSPGNLMISFSGITKIVDFGVAYERDKLGRERQDKQLKGKLAYMAPERIRDHVSDRRSDVYSIGVILYLIFTGHLPFPQRNDAELLRAIVGSSPPRPSLFRPIPADIEEIIVTAMEKDPTRRYPSAAALGAALNTVLVGYGRPSLQLDVATYLGSLFPEDDEIPASIRARLGLGKPARRHGVRAETAATTLAIPAGKSRSPLVGVDNSSVIEIDICLEDSDLVTDIPEGSTAEDVGSVAALFSATATGSSVPRLPTSITGAPHNTTRIFTEVSRRPAGGRTAEIFASSSRRRRDSEQREWPWSEKLRRDSRK